MSSWAICTIVMMGSVMACPSRALDALAAAHKRTRRSEHRLNKWDRCYAVLFDPVMPCLPLLGP